MSIYSPTNAMLGITKPNAKFDLLRKAVTECNVPRGDLVVFIHKNPELINTGLFDNEQTLLHLAVSAENLPIVEWLMDKGANVDVADSQGISPLGLAISKQITPTINLLKRQHSLQQSLRFINNGDGTVTDTKNHLMWGQSTEISSWIEAKDKRQQLAGYEDWRLPTIEELKTLLVFSLENPSLYANYFPSTPNDVFWSSTDHRGLHFLTAVEHSCALFAQKYMRFVRSASKVISKELIDKTPASSPLKPISASSPRFIDNGDGTVHEALSKSKSIQEDLEITVSRLNEELKGIRNRYEILIDLDEEKSKLSVEIDALKLNRDQTLNENNIKFQKLNDEYIVAKKIFDHLNTEILKLEENLDISSFGLYKPHYNYDTPESYKLELEKIIDQAKLAIKSDNAIICTTQWEVNGSIVQGRKMTRHYSKIMLRAFNGECDAAVLKVRWNNVTNMEERILKSFEAINKLGETHSISVTNNYLELKMKELRLTYEYQEKLHDEKDEQRRIREQLREEERSLREIEKARQEAEKEEIRYAKALQKAREELFGASEMEVDDLRNKIHDLEIHLKNAQELKECAISMAQITKAGHVYIISNIGSFGDNVYKIGMTRRMEPSDRVRELSGASVPFGFDIHAMIYSENAPELENKFHKKFAYNRLNLNNNRKEFFNVTLDDIENFAHENGHVVEFTKMAEARDYRQTHAIRNVKSKAEIEAEMSQVFPDQLIDVDDEDDNNGEV